MSNKDEQYIFGMLAILVFVIILAVGSWLNLKDSIDRLNTKIDTLIETKIEQGVSDD